MKTLGEFPKEVEKLNEETYVYAGYTIRKHSKWWTCRMPAGKVARVKKMDSEIRNVELRNSGRFRTGSTMQQIIEYIERERRTLWRAVHHIERENSEKSKTLIRP